MTSEPSPVALPEMSRISGLGEPALAARELDFVPKIEGYEIYEKLGEGGMGTVWHAMQLSTRRKVALKLMSAAIFGSEKAKARFDREVELTARLAHPNIAQVFDSGLDRGIFYYAMERVDGVPLDLYVDSHTMSRRDILQLMRTICLAVKHAHQRGVIHRDLKPNNILVSADGEPHLLDFGLAKPVLQENVELSVSGDGFAGTPAYMSPEQAAGHVSKLDIRTDVYSLGVIMYRLLLGKSPHELTGSQLEVMRRISEQDVIPPRSVDPKIDRELESLLCKTLARQQDDRYASAGELARDLDNYLSGEPLLARPPTFFYVIRKQLAKYVLPASITTAILVILIATAIFSYIRVSHAAAVAALESDQKDYLIRFTNELSRQPTVEAMLQLIVDRAMATSEADAGTLYVVQADGKSMRVEVARNKTIELREGREAFTRRFTKDPRPISQQWIGGYVAETGRVLDIDNAYDLPANRPYQFNSKVDHEFNYHSESMLVVPLVADQSARVQGVLQLINRKDVNGKITPFPKDERDMIEAMAQQAATILRLRATGVTEATTAGH